jgi:uncharacterized membrane-anchored protein
MNAPARKRGAAAWLTEHGALRVPQVAAMFWVLKGLSTAMGEATSDYLVHAINPVVAVLATFVAFVVTLVVKFTRHRYDAWTYWITVVMVGVFGTMAADVFHVVLKIPYTASTAFYAIVLLAVFVTWRAVEGTLSIHSIDSPRREAFYWAAVAATFAMGTALGDLTAYTLHLGYFVSAVVFVGAIAVPAIGYRLMRWTAVFSFWFAYVMTRPLGASIADGLGKPKSVSGLGLGSGPVALVCGVVILILVAYVAHTKLDAPRAHS